MKPERKQHRLFVFSEEASQSGFSGWLYLLGITMALSFMIEPLHSQPADEIPTEEQRQRSGRIDIIGVGEDQLDRVPGSAEHIDREMLERTRPVSTQDALSRLPGLHTVDTDGYGFFPRISIRGLDQAMSRKVLLLEDGAPIALGPFIDPASYYMSPVERMQAVEVLKGSGTIVNGPNTIGGTINFITKDPPGERQGLLTVEGGSDAYRMGMFEYGGTWNNVGVLVNYIKKSGDGNRANNSFDMDDVMLKFGMGLGDDHYLGFKFTYHQNDINATYLGLTQDMYDYDFPDRRYNPTPDDEIEVRRFSADVNHEWQINNNLRMHTLFYVNQASRDWFRAGIQRDSLELASAAELNTEDPLEFTYTLRNPNDTGGRVRTFEVAGIDHRYNLNHNLFGIQNETDFGIRFHTETMYNKRINNNFSSAARSGVIRDDDDRHATSLAGFIQNRFNISDDFSITPGVRYEGYRQRRIIKRIGNTDIAEQAVFFAENPDQYNGENLTGRSSTWNEEMIPGIGTRYRITDLATVFAGVHKGFAPPRVQDAISNDGVETQLRAERSVNYEAGIRGHGERFRYSLTGFRYDFSNQIIAAAESGGATTAGPTNAGETRNQGFEASIGYEIVKDLFFDVNWTRLVDAKVTNDRVPVPDLEIDETTSLTEVEAFWLDRWNRQWNSFLPAEHRNQKDNRLPYAPRDIVNAGLTWSYGKLTLNASMQYTGEQYTDFENTESTDIGSNLIRLYINNLIPDQDYKLAITTDGTRGKIESYTTWNFGGSYDFTDNFQGFFTVRNAFDKQYIASRQPEGIFPGMYQMVTFGATAKF